MTVPLSSEAAVLRREQTAGALAVIVVLASMTTFAIALGMDAYTLQYTNDKSVTFSAYSSFLTGCFGPIDKVFAWYANPALFAGWFFIFRRKSRLTSVAMGGLALVLAASFRLNTTIIANEGGDRAIVTDYLEGYSLWMASICLFTLGSLITVAASLTKDPFLIDNTPIDDTAESREKQREIARQRRALTRKTP